MRFDRYFVARFHAVGFPSLCGDLTDRAHFERPFERSASGRIGDVHVEPAMRIGVFEFFESSGDRYRFFMIEHCEGMMGPRVNSEGSHCKNDESGEFQIHGSPLDDSLPQMFLFRGSIPFLYHESPNSGTVAWGKTGSDPSRETGVDFDRRRHATREGSDPILPHATVQELGTEGGEPCVGSAS